MAVSTTLLLLVAAENVRAFEPAHATVRIVAAESIDFSRFEKRAFGRDAHGHGPIYRETESDDVDSGGRRYRLIEFP